MKVEVYFDDVFLKCLEDMQPKKSGIYRKVFKELMATLRFNYLNSRKAAREQARVKGIEEEATKLKFFYCESEDDYFLGQRVDNFYYATFDKESKRFVWRMSRYLPWGKHVVDDKTLWKEHTYPSEPIEISFSEWLLGFLNKYYPNEND